MEYIGVYIFITLGMIFTFGGLGWYIYISNKPPQKKMEYNDVNSVNKITNDGLSAGGWSLPNKNTKKHLDSNTEEMILKEAYMIARCNMYCLINDLNIDYMLGIDDGEIEDIIDTDDLETAQKRLEFYVDETPITVQKFNENMTANVRNILRHDSISPEHREDIMEFVRTVCDIMDEERVQHFVKKYSIEFPGSLSFLNERINYTCAALDLLYHFAVSYEDDILKARLKIICDKRGLDFSALEEGD